MSINCFRPSALWSAVEQLKSDNAQGEYYLTDVVPLIIASGGTMRAELSTVDGEELGVNTPEDLRLAEAALLERRKQG